MLIDTHAHLDFPAFANDLDAVIARAAEAGVTRIIVVGTDVEDSQRSVALAERYDNLFAVVGVHPNSAIEAQDDAIDQLRKLAAHPKVVAIGETGLDYFRLPKAETEQKKAVKAAQKRLFSAQLELAAELGLNVVIHQRGDCRAETLELMAPFHGKLRAVFHCFGGGIQEARELIDLGHLVSFTGIVTFKNGEVVQEAAAQVPGDAYMVETDCPFLAPVPHRGQRCEPAFTRHTAEKIAALRNESLEEVARQTTATAEAFFRLPPR